MEKIIQIIIIIACELVAIALINLIGAIFYALKKEWAGRYLLIANGVVLAASLVLTGYIIGVLATPEYHYFEIRG